MFNDGLSCYGSYRSKRSCLILASFIAKKLLPYRGLGSGILRALEAWPQIDFKDDREACLFTATIWRPAV